MGEETNFKKINLQNDTIIESLTLKMPKIIYAKNAHYIAFQSPTPM